MLIMMFPHLCDSWRPLADVFAAGRDRVHPDDRQRVGGGQRELLVPAARPAPRQRARHHPQRAPGARRAPGQDHAHQLRRAHRPARCLTVHSTADMQARG